jgi:hypothetical protein
LEHGQVHDVSSAEEKEDMDKKRVNMCRKKQSHTFRVRGVKRKRRASLGVLEVSAITKHGEAKRNFEFIGEYKDRQLESSWREMNIGIFSPWEDIADEAERLLAISKGGRNEGGLILFWSIDQNELWTKEA